MGESQIEAFNYDLDTNFNPTHNRATVSALFDLRRPFLGQTLAPSLNPKNQSIVKYTFNVSLNADSEKQYQELTFHNCADSGSGCEGATLANDNRFVRRPHGRDSTCEPWKDLLLPRKPHR